jgi:hypothetical protein
MTKETQLKIFDIFASKMREVCSSKGDDYAGEDRLSNFKLAGQIANQSSNVQPEMNCLNLIATKVARLGQLLSSSKDVSNEPIEDSVLDLAIYSFLLHCIREEKAIERTWSELEGLREKHNNITPVSNQTSSWGSILTNSPQGTVASFCPKQKEYCHNIPTDDRCWSCFCDR